MYVKCINCNLIWEYISEEKTEPLPQGEFDGGCIIRFKQTLCPKCSSNAFIEIKKENLTEEIEKKLLYG